VEVSVGVTVGVTVGVIVGVSVGVTVGVGEEEAELIVKVRTQDPDVGDGVTSCAKGILDGTLGATGCCRS